MAFEKYFLRKMRRGESEPFYERFLLDKLNIAKDDAAEDGDEYEDEPGPAGGTPADGPRTHDFGG